MSKLPEGWEIVEFGNLGDIKFSNVDKKFHEGQCPVLLCNYMDVYKNEHIDSKIKFMTASAAIQEIDRFKLNKFDVLFTKDSETPDDIANSSVVTEVLENVICGYHLALVRPNASIVYGPFLSKQIKSDFVRRQFIVEAKGSTRFGLGLNSIFRIQIPLPPLEEQKKIAEILISVDRSIEATEKLIAKLSDLKKALMQELFTKGLPDEALAKLGIKTPRKFKNSPLGKIPEDWEVVSIGALLQERILETIQDGNHGELHPKTSDFKKQGIPFVMATDIISGKINFDQVKRISEEQYNRLRVGFSQGNDVLLSHKASIGFVAIVPAHIEKLMLTPQVTLYRIGNNNKLSSIFLYYVFQSPNFQSMLSVLAKQSTRDYIGITNQRNLDIVLPSDLEEQAEIASILSANDAKIEKAQKRLEKLKDMKKGLMQDLLTGKVRVM